MITSIKVGPMTYKVEEVEGLKEVNPDGSTSRLVGQVLYYDEMIEIEANLSPRLKAISLLHEATHAMLYQGGLNDISEKVSINLGYSLYAFVRENPELIMCIMGDNQSTASQSTDKTN